MDSLSYEPPQRYGVDTVTLMARDPGMLFAYWEITPASWEAAHRLLSGPVSPRLVLTDETIGRTEMHAISWEPGDRYLPVEHGGHTYRVTVGLWDGARFTPLLSSHPVTTPPGRESAWTDTEWSTIEALYALWRRRYRAPAGSSQLSHATTSGRTT